MKRRPINLTAYTRQLQAEVSQFLQQAQQERVGQAANLSQVLLLNREMRRAGVNETLAQLAQTRQEAAQELRAELDENRNQRTAAVSTYLNEVQAEHQTRRQQLNEMLAASRANREAAVAEMMANFRASHRQPAPYLAEMPATAPVTSDAKIPATTPPAKTETSKAAEISSIKASELVAYLMETTGKITLDDLEKHFGAKRLQANWDEFIGLLDDLRPGSRSELEAAKKSSRAKRQKDGLTTPAAIG